MFNNKIEVAFNKQINEELFSSYLYLSMSAYFASIALEGFSSWMRVQAMEEMIHAQKFYNFIIERGGRVTLDSIAKPQIDWKSPLEAFEDTYKHEQHITSCINKLVDLAIKERDHASNNFLQWFVAEQVEEEASAESILQKLKLIGDKGNGIFMLDKELGQRVFVMPPATK